MRPLSDIVIYFYEHQRYGQPVMKSQLRRFSEMDLEMLVDMGILYSYMDHFHGMKMYRLRKPRTTSKGTAMIYSQRVQYAREFYKRKQAA